jgi:three-Cys-motif partner protein
MDEVDPADGLPISEVGEWALEKHARLRKYIDIYRDVRKKFTDPNRAPNFRGGATYIDLFCGPGRAKVRETGLLIDGSPLVAVKSAIAGKYPFSEIHLADLNRTYSEAAVKRVSALGANARGYTGEAEHTCDQVIAALNPYGLHFAFLDPFNLDNLSFMIIRKLSTLKHIDLLLHVSVQDLQRNLARYEEEKPSALDTFAPGWRSQVNLKRSIAPIRADILRHWQGLVRSLGFIEPRGVELVTGSVKQRLYWLIFLRKNKIANDFWDKIRNISGQGDLL